MVPGALGAGDHWQAAQISTDRYVHCVKCPVLSISFESTPNRPKGKGQQVKSLDTAIAAPVASTATDEVPSWHLDALCAQTDPEEFFPPPGGATSRAKQVCAGCIVRASCLDHALTNNEQHGIWGGKTPRERQELQLAAATESRPALQQQQALTTATLSAQNVPAEAIANHLGITTRQVNRIRSRTA
ncbi:WhiB family transcriptional regulator [Rhodococcus yunnanensis]|uniref:WhiB family transcriptional regulator n=1 Tax=Rhodococcoides yunnanense TaxID=278209 RepID=UPI0022B1E6F9|nr:WhiB family transcriptional regulator [Rhodococcus yunnanensis]MCZ4277786.1 WhiB family transcriptional regulator [Rhodococcus yunnanensis]